MMKRIAWWLLCVPLAIGVALFLVGAGLWGWAEDTQEHLIDGR